VRARTILLLFLMVLLGCAGQSNVAVIQGPGTSPPPNVLAPLPPLPIEEPPRTLGGQGPYVAYTDPGELPHLTVARRPDQKLPLQHTSVKAHLTGFVAEVEVSQTYQNPFSTPIEAIYVFPLPENSAVHHMRMVIGQRVIEAEIQRRGEARATYQAAKRAGHTAALMEQERPNVFTQSLANLEPGQPIEVVIGYVQDLTYDAGQYEFVFPMVVGPRHMPGQTISGPQLGRGMHADTSEVEDASRISPPIVGLGERSGRDISVEVTVDGALPVFDLDVPTHQAAAGRAVDGSTRVALLPHDSLPNRDFLLRYRVARQEPEATLMVSPTATGGGYFSLVVEPPAMDVESTVGWRELIFVVDVSGSMRGQPLKMSRTAIREALRRLRPVDTFDIVTFSSDARRVFGRPRPANLGTIREALARVRAVQARGSTQMTKALDQAFGTEVEPGRHRYVFFLTDGYVGNEAAVMARAQEFVAAAGRRGQRARVFTMGVGSSPNRHLIDGLAQAGQGLPVYATSREDPLRAVNLFYGYIDRPVLQGATVNWGGLQVSDLCPPVMPDLFASHPLVVHGRYQGEPGPISVSGTVPGRQITLPTRVYRIATQGEPTRVLGTLWARARVADLMEDILAEGNRAAIEQVTQLGLQHRLVTPYTSFVAVDRSRVVSGGNPATVLQPQDQPEGVELDRRASQPRTEPPPPPAPATPAPSPAKGAEAGKGAAKQKHADEAKAPLPPIAKSRHADADKAPPSPAGTARWPAAEPAATPVPGPAAGAAAPGAAPGYAAPPSQPPSYGAPMAPGYPPPPTVGQNQVYMDNAPAMGQAEKANYANAPPERVEPKRGCGCRTPGSENTDARSLVLIAGALLLARLRRRRRA
jgi:Ca-activated chloride channel homolog